MPETKVIIPLQKKYYTGEQIHDVITTCVSDYDTVMAILKKFAEMPSAQPDRGYIEQIKWERDLAIRQLADLGYGLGEKLRTNGDSISRQAAIDAVGDIHPLDYNAQAIKARIEQLPSAQPEQPVVIRCKDCKFYNDAPCGIVDWWNTADDFCSRARRREEGGE